MVTIKVPRWIVVTSQSGLKLINYIDPDWKISYPMSDRITDP